MLSDIFGGDLMGLLDTLKGGMSAGGSSNSARGVSISNTAGREATASSNQQAITANSSAMSAWREASEYNTRQAQIQREWQERMANTTYQRTVEDMKKAGINPILAAGLGLSADSVGSGATASMSSPETYMAQSFAEQNSASNSESHGSSWNQSESGLATGLKLMGDAIAGAISKINASKTIDIAINGLQQYTRDLENKEKKQTVEHNKQVNGNGNPFKKGTHGYQMYEMQKAFQK